MTLLDEDYATVDMISIFGAQSNGPALAVGGPRTDAGIGLGEIYDDLQSPYPDLQRTGDYPDSYVTYRITDGSGWILFDLSDGIVNRIRWPTQRSTTGIPRMNEGSPSLSATDLIGNLSLIAAIIPAERSKNAGKSNR